MYTVIYIIVRHANASMQVNGEALQLVLWLYNHTLIHQIAIPTFQQLDTQVRHH